MFQIKVLEKIKTHVLCSVTFSRKLCRLWDNVENMVDTEATDNNIIWCMCCGCWISKTTCVHAQANVPSHPRKHARMQKHSCTNTCMQAPSRTRARTRTHSHTQLCNTYYFPRQKLFRERASVLRYTYIGL